MITGLAAGIQDHLKKEYIGGVRLVQGHWDECYEDNDLFACEWTLAVELLS